MRSVSRVEIILGSVALLFYLSGIDWALPYATDSTRLHGWAYDTITPLDPLSQLKDLTNETPHEWVPYPLMHYMVLAVVYTPYLLYLVVTGGLTLGQSHYPFGLADPVGVLQILELIGKSVSTVMAVGIVVVVYRTGKILWGEMSGIIAGIFIMLVYPMVYYSRTGNIDVPVLFWTSFGILLLAHIVVEGLSTKRAVWLGMCAAFATGTKDLGWGAFSLMPLVLLALQYSRSRQSGEPVSWRPLLLGAVACVGAYSIASGFLLSPRRYVAHLRWISDHVPFPALEHFPPTLEGYAGLFWQALGHVENASGPLIFGMALVGIVGLSVQQPRMLVMVVPAIGHFVAVLVPTRETQLRYVMPMVLEACLLAAYPLALGLRNSSRWLRILSGIVLVVGSGWLLIVALDLTYQMRVDSRYAAARWLEGRTQPGDVIGHFVDEASLPQMKNGLQYVLLPSDETALTRITEGRPALLIVMPHWSSKPGNMTSIRMSEGVYRKIIDGTAGYRLVARFKTPGLMAKQILDYPTVNPPVEIYEPIDRRNVAPNSAHMAGQKGVDGNEEWSSV